MNYYERHLGDYARDTAHLTMLEHGAYGLLLDRYYSTEGGIAEDQAHRLARAKSPAERAAVDAVLSEFFKLIDGVWINSRASREIEKAHTKIDAARRNGKNGGRPKKNPAATDEKPTGFPLGYENVTQSKAHHTPDTRHQIPDTSNTHTPPPTEAARVCGLMRRTGMADVSPGHPDLLALVAAGATDAEFEHAATQAGERGKGFVYALGMLKRQRSEASALTLHQGPLPAKVSAREQAKGERIYNMTGGLMGIAPAAKKEFIDAEPSSRPALG